MKSIKEITKKLFSIDYETDLEDDNVSEIYENLADEFIKTNKWLDIYKCWYDYLINDCKTEQEVLNFANLFWFYEGYNQFIPNAVEFCTFFYTCISFEHPEATPVVDGIAWHALVNAGVINKFDFSFDNFAPNDFKILTDEINKWKEKGYGLH